MTIEAANAAWEDSIAAISRTIQAGELRREQFAGVFTILRTLAHKKQGHTMHTIPPEYFAEPPAIGPLHATHEHKLGAHVIQCALHAGWDSQGEQGAFEYLIQFYFNQGIAQAKIAA